MSIKKKTALLWVTVALCLVATVALWFASRNVEVSYTEVQATVVSSRKVQSRVYGSTMTTYEVVVSYLGKEYDLKNAHDAYSYTPGRTITAYRANGKLYANVEGITSTTPVAILYYVFLIGTFVLAVGGPLYLDKQKKKLAAAEERARRAARTSPTEGGYRPWGT